ncbi:MAG: acyl-CoA dehydratase activase [Desulfatiglandales bacterium]
MVTAGVDVGSRAVKVAILNNSTVMSHSALSVGRELTPKVAENALQKALATAKLSAKDIEYTLSTGRGRKQVPYSNSERPDVACLARASNWLFPSARTVVDVGGEKCVALRRNQKGKPISININDKCASGTGIFLETVAKMLQVNLEEIGELSLRAKEEITISSTCAIFVESEIISLIHTQGKKAPDILRGIHEGIARRIGAMLTSVGVDGGIVLTGGVAQNAGFVAALKKQIEADILVPQDPVFVAALGAALLAQEERDSRK